MKRLLTFLLILPFATQAWAETTFEVGNLKYTVIEGTTNVSVGKASTPPSGALSIPEKVTNPDNSVEYTVTSIGDDAFYDCSGLTTVTIPNSVTSIGYCAFFGCRGLTTITIPQSVNTIFMPSPSYGIYELIGLHANLFPFGNCSNLTEINVESTNTNYTSENGVLYDKNKTTIICYPAGKTGTTYTIPNTVTTIGPDAFGDCSRLMSVSIPNIVTCIGHYAFSDCSGLTSITIPTSVTSIGNGAFYGCSGLTSVTIGNSVTSIGKHAFSGCSGLTSISIPNSVKSIGNDAFYGCSGLTKAEFASVESLCSINFDDEDANPLSYVHHLYITGEENEVTEVVISNSVTSIGSFAFSGCYDLTSVVFQNSVTSIGSYAFYGCSGLTSITLPISVTSIGSGAFTRCGNLTEVNVESANTNYTSENGVLYDKNKTTIICYPAGKTNTTYTIPNSVTSIGDEGFYGCVGLTSVIIPNSVKRIGSGAFSGCNGLTSVTIPNSVTSIGSDAFDGCSGLTSVTIPKSVTSIGNGAFDGCSGLTSVTIPKSVSIISLNAFRGCVKATFYCETNFRPSRWSSNWTNRKSDYIKWGCKVVRAEANNGKVEINGANYAVKGDDGSLWYLTKNGTATLTATASGVHPFIKWNDYDTSNPRIVNVTGSKTYTAIFEEHTEIIDAAVPATCTAPGLTEGKHCAVCNDVLVAQVESEPPLGHLFTNYIYNNDATTEADGTETAECDHGCGTTDTRVSAGTRLPDNPTAVTSTDRNALSISVVRGAIVVNNAASDIVVYDTAGRIVARQKPQQQNVIVVSGKGVYIVRCGKDEKKVVIL